MKLFKLKEGVVIVERRDDIFVGHLDRQVLFTNKSLKSILRELSGWSDLTRIERATGAPIAEIHDVLLTLHSVQFLSQSSMQSLATKITISHFNEIGRLLASHFLEMGFSVATSDEAVVDMSDVRGQLIQIADVGLSYREILAAQRREIINSGNHEILNLTGAERISEERSRSLMIVTTYPEPEFLAHLMEKGTEYFCVVATPSGVVLGPWVKPGLTPCFHCIELHRSDQDDQWQKVATELFAQRRERLAAGHAFAAAGLVIGMEELWNQSEITHGEHEKPEIFLQTSHFLFTSRPGHAMAGCEVIHRTWPFHPECSCHWSKASSTRAG